MRGDLALGIDAPSELEALRIELGAEWPAIRASRERAVQLFATLRAELVGCAPADTSIIVFGSLARLETTSGSDVDWTLLVDGAADPQHLDAALEIERRLRELGVRPPGREGTFGGLAFSHDLLHNIGGEDDTNRNTTRRILLLLESTAIGDPAAHDRVVRNLLRRYIQEDVDGTGGDSPFKVPRFLQNDIARYWRTMAVDFAYKRRLRAREGWALRTAKLRMSRKLIYAAGLLACFSCAVEFEPRLEEPRQIGVFRVVDHLAALVRTPPLDIIARFARRFPELGAAAADLFGAYDGFLALLDDPERRGRLKAIPPEEAAADPVYGEVKKLGASFQHALDRFFFESDGTPLPSLTRKYGVF